MWSSIAPAFLAVLAVGGPGCPDSLTHFGALDGKPWSDSAAALERAGAGTGQCDQLVAAVLRALLTRRADTALEERTAADRAVDAAWTRWPNEPHLTLATVVLRYNQGQRNNAERAGRRIVGASGLSPHEAAVLRFVLGSVAQDEWRDWRSYGALALNIATGQMTCKALEARQAELDFARRSDPNAAWSLVQFNTTCPVEFERIMDQTFHSNRELGLRARRQLSEDFGRAMALDPKYWPPVRAMASEAIFEGDWRALADLARSAERSLPGDYRPVVLEALAAYRSGQDLAHSSARFNAARALMPADIGLVYDDIGRVLSPAESLRFAGATTGTQQELREEFWRSHQVVFLDRANDRLIEHFARVTEAGFLFAEPTTDRMGWDSDAGRVWIRYGRPLKIRDLEQDVRRWSFWSYGAGPNFVFTRNLRYWSYRIHEHASAMTEEMAEKMPTRFRPPEIDSVRTLPRQVVRFWSPADSSEELLVLAPYIRAENPSDLRVGVTLLDSAFQRAASWTGGMGREGGLLATLTLRSAGTFRLVVEQLDPRTRFLAQSRDTLTLSVPAGLATSDILMARGIEGPASAHGWRQLHIDELWGMPVADSEPFALYWEVYGLTPDSLGTVRYTANIEVTSGPRSFLARLLSGIAGRSSQPEATVSFDRVTRTIAGRVPNWINLQASLVPGHYTVAVSITDKVSGRTTTTSRAFEARSR